MKTCYRPSSLTFNVSCNPDRVARTIASLRLYTRRAAAIKLEIIDIITMSTRCLIIVLVSFRTMTPICLGDILPALAELRQVTGRPVTECSWCCH